VKSVDGEWNDPLINKVLIQSKNDHRSRVKTKLENNIKKDKYVVYIFQILAFGTASR
jgi:hypothetical protein